MKARLIVIFVILFTLNFPTKLFSKSIKEISIVGIENTDKTDSAKEETLSDKVKGCYKNECLFTVYQDTVTGSLQVYISKDQIGKEFIYQSFSLGGPPSLFLNQNMIRNTWIFKIEKTFEKLEWSRLNTRFYYDSANAISKSANVDVSEALFFSEKIVAEDSLGYLIKGDNLFLSEKLDPIKPFVSPKTPAESYLNLGALKSDKSSYIDIRSFPKNTDILVNLSYENAKPVNFGDKYITDARFIQVKMQHSFIELPDNDYTPRFDDPRIGYFNQEVDNMTTTEIPKYRDIINRWNLKKANPDAELSEPVKPIVWWVENTTPVELREIIVEAGFKWNEAFEKAGFKNAVVMKIMPDTATWDPADIRYNVIRWVSSNLGYAIGPSFVNPRTGEILGADITIDYGMFSMTASLEDLVELNTQLEHDKHDQCHIGSGLKMQHGAGMAMLETRNVEESELGKLNKQFMTFLILHEMGHTMGLNHNMKASHMLSPEEVNNQEITHNVGVAGSVMDYPIINIAYDGSKQGDYYTTKIGPYDAWAIEYGYKPFNSSDERDELIKIASRSTDPQLIFGNDADITFPGRGIDPRVAIWDMSNDPVSYAENRFKLVNKLLPKMIDRFAEDGKSYQNLLTKFNYLQAQRLFMASSVSHYIGGVYVDRSYPEQESENKPYTPVAYSYQKRAMNIMNKYVFSPNAFAVDRDVFAFLQAQRRGFNFMSKTEDPKIDKYVQNLQNTVLEFILHPVTLRRVNNSTYYGNTYNVTSVFADLTDGLFDEDLNSNVNLYRQNAQMEFVERLIAIVKDAKNQYDYPSESAAFNSLNSIKSKLKKSKTGNDQTKAHRSHLIFKIDKLLSLDK